MLGCNETVTITHLGYDGDADQDTEQVQTFYGCSWQGQTRATAGKDGLSPGSVYKCRIPVSAGVPVVARGDRLQCGDVTATVTAVHDNRGRPAPHIYLEAE